MSYEHAGTSYRNEHEAQIDQIHEWVTATGDTPTTEALAAYWDDPEGITDELERDHRAGDWTIPGLDDGCERSDIVDLLEDWEEWARGHAIREIRDELGITQAEMADMLRLSGKQRIYEYEKGIETPSKQVVMLAEWRREPHAVTCTIEQLENYWACDRDEWGLLGPADVAGSEIVRLVETEAGSGEYTLERQDADGTWYMAQQERLGAGDVPGEVEGESD